MRFRQNIVGSRTYLEIYLEIRQLKNLGRRGTLSQANQYLLWLPRAAVVSAVSSLDAYVHNVLDVHVSKVLTDPNKEISSSLADVIPRAISSKKKEEIHELLRFIRDSDGARMLATELREKIFRFESYQAPKAVVSAFKLLGVDDILAEAADRWQGPQTTRADIAARLNRYVNRRNQIAHEADSEGHGVHRAITPDYAWNCIEFIEDLVERIDPSL